MKIQLKADLMLLLVTFFWGASILLTKVGLNYMQEYNLISLRFIIAFLLSGIVFYKHLIKIDFRTIKYAFILAVILFIVYIFATFGTKYTSVSNAGFLMSLTVIFIPVLSSIFLKQRPEKKVILGVVLTIVGIGLLTLNSQLKIGYGDILCILCALFYAVHIIITGTITKQVNSISLGVLQLGFVGLFSSIFSMFMENPKLPSTVESWFSILVLSIFCTAMAFIVQIIAQQYTSPTHTGLIFSLEPVFSAGFAFVFTGETLTAKGYLGATLILLSVVIAELDFKSLLKTNYKKNIG
ncbi:MULTISPECIES: DMT family transporter [Bacillus]|uniref:DMT family transporter n=2 Tax=Bacillus pseudomycoides TaxID=64104 RepID=A0AAJ1YY19_9BACI|nr:DMT family transporter [Bacillus pseudomycoides]MCR8857983.1 DMT family transporter [Bacillus pseudomycoides]MDR4326265.1 DMT family transporter [Bacillus pseudomycoides]MED1534029.1 DMT family transporter [Bacillus pseudomycoides]PDZ09824.1 EamA family transporter [Bacillus pseudomycoides]PEF26178.1 EamA family transporter [Bacillus pseudomycoides]